MEYLFTSSNLKVLESFSFVETLYAFDYDGTLAAINQSPDQAVLSKDVEDKLKRLNRLVPLAIISGRSLENLEAILPFRPSFLIGNHGIESHQNDKDLSALETQCRTWIEKLENHYGQIFNEMGIFLEDKRFSLSLHYRKSHNPLAAENLISLALSNFTNAKIIHGKMIYDIVPDLAMDKGTALNQLMKKENFRFGFYIGDDRTDEDVFCYRNPSLITIKIGNDHHSNARFFLKNQSEVSELLQRLLDFNLFHQILRPKKIPVE